MLPDRVSNPGPLTYESGCTVENNTNKTSGKFQGDMLNFCDFIQVFVFTTNHHLKPEFTHSLNTFFTLLSSN